MSKQMQDKTSSRSLNKPFIVDRDMGTFKDTNTYFDYTSTLASILDHLTTHYQCPMKLYYENESNDVWDVLADDIRSGYEGIEHISSIFDLVETTEFSYESNEDGKKMTIRSSIRNNLFGYPKYKVVFARVPVMERFGLGVEELIFAPDDANMQAFLEEMGQRQQSNRKLTVFTDTKDGLERRRESISRMITREHVIMDASLKVQIFRYIDEFFSQDKSFFSQYDIPYKRGILLYGKPGNGKTTLVKSIAGSVSAPVVYWQITEYTTSESINEVFVAADKISPMVLVIEDVDSMPDSCRSFFLNTLDGVASKEGVFLIGTTNYPEKIDPALMNRAGRFDRAHEVVQPDEQLRASFLELRGMDKLVGKDGMYEAARLTDGFSLAQLGELYVSAALQQYYEGKIELKKLVTDLKNDLKKDKRGDWIRDSAKNTSVGFL